MTTTLSSPTSNHNHHNDKDNITTTTKNIVHLHQQKCDGRITNPYNYVQSIHQYHHSSWKQFVQLTWWEPSRTRLIYPSTSSSSHNNNNITTITTHMDLFHNGFNDNHHNHHHNTDQFLITINTKTPSSHSLYDALMVSTNSGSPNSSTIAIYNLWEDHPSPKQHSRRQPSSTSVNDRMQQSSHRRRLQQQQDDDDDDDDDNEQDECLEFRPIQETVFTTTTTTPTHARGHRNRGQNLLPESRQKHHILSGIQWYPIDTGTFITSTISNGGYVTLWDTNHMIPVLNCQPYIHVHNDNNNNNSNAASLSTSSSTGMYSQTPYGRPYRGRMTTGRQSSAQANAPQQSSRDSSSGGICTMHIGSQQPHLVATGSHRSDMTKIVDLRSSSTSHTLMIGTYTSFLYDRDSTGSSSSSRANNRSVTSVQWSPIQSNTLATCTNGNCYVWDIRSTVQPIAICGNTYLPTNKKDVSVSSACYSIDAYLSQHRKSPDQMQQRMGLIANRTNPQHQQQRKLLQQQQQQLSGREVFETLKFDCTGQYLITLSQKSKVPNESFISVFDLLSPALSSDFEVPMYPSTRTLHSYTSIQDQPRGTGLSQPKSILFLTGHKPIHQKVWVSTFYSASLSSFKMLLDHNIEEDDDDEEEEFCTNDLLHGHMGRIRCCAVMTGPNRIRQRQRSATNKNNNNNTYAPCTIVTAAEDGLMLIWEQQRNQTENKNTNTNEDHNKRQRLCMSQQVQQPSLGAGDYDTW